MGLHEFDKPMDENRGLLYMWMREVINMQRPAIFVAENVKGLVSLGEAKEIISNDFSTIGKQVLKASNFGIPQTRERVFFIGINKERVPEELLKTIEADPFDRRWNPYPEIHKGELPKLRGILKDLPEPNNSNDLSQRTYSKAKWYGRHCQGQIEVNLAGFAPTIRSEHHGNIEFRRLHSENGGKYEQEIRAGKEQRRLTVRECARIQTFPDDFEFVFKSIYGSVSGSEAYKLIGDAVPPLLAYQLAQRIEVIWDYLFTK